MELCGGATYLIAELTRIKDAVLVDVDHLRTKPVRRLTVQHIRVQPKQPRLDRGERRAFPAAMVTLLADWRETADRPERGATYAAEAAARKVRLSIAARESRSPDMAEVRWIQVGSATKRNLVGDEEDRCETGTGGSLHETVGDHGHRHGRRRRHLPLPTVAQHQVNGATSGLPAAHCRRRAKIECSRSPMCNYSQVATDMDGTFLSPPPDVSGHVNGELTQRSVALAQSLTASGVVFAIATGRPAPALQPHIDALGIDAGIPCICFNGAAVLQMAPRSAVAL